MSMTSFSRAASRTRLQIPSIFFRVPRWNAGFSEISQEPANSSEEKKISGEEEQNSKPKEKWV